LFDNKIDLFLRTATTDISVFNQIIIQRDYDINIPFIPTNILDAGSNIGLSSVFFSKNIPLQKHIRWSPIRITLKCL
jgi:hypothetical protein